MPESPPAPRHACCPVSSASASDGVAAARPRLLLLDGHSLAYRAFFALPVENFSTTTGQHTNAVYGFTAMLINVLRDEQPTHLAVAFDVSRATFRGRAVRRVQGQPGQVARRVPGAGLLDQGGAQRPAGAVHREGRLRGRRHHRHAGHPGDGRRLRGADLLGRPRLLPAGQRPHHGHLPDARRLGDEADDPGGGRGALRPAAGPLSRAGRAGGGELGQPARASRASDRRRQPSGSPCTTASTTWSTTPRRSRARRARACASTSTT